MKRFLRVLRIGLLGLAALALVGYAALYGVSQRMLNRTYMDQPWVDRIVAPDLTRVAREHSDAELERVIRWGVRRSPPA